MRRRRFIGLTGAALFHATMAEGHVEGAWLEEIGATLTEENPGVDHRPLSLSALTTAVENAKRGFQRCRYTEVARALPTTLRELRLAGHTYEGDDRLRAQALLAEAYHATASLLLKHEDKGLAWLAADRSMRAARACQSRRMIASSSRIITHALMSENHNQTALDLATRTANRMSADLDMTNADDLSVYGALVLRGAIAAAQRGSRHAVTELLDEAEDAGHRLGRDDNRMWTTFGPTNVLVHRVTVNLALGDAGAALAAARKIDLDQVLINERKAVLLTHSAKAFLQWGKHDRALEVLRAAQSISPEEITFWPSTRRLVGDLLISAPPSLRREVREFAAEIGANA